MFTTQKIPVRKILFLAAFFGFFTGCDSQNSSANEVAATWTPVVEALATSTSLPVAPTITPSPPPTETRPPTATETAGPDQVLIYTCEIDGARGIYSISLADNTQTLLTSKHNDVTSPNWSPDGSKIAFLSWEGYSTRLVIMNFDTMDQFEIDLQDVTFFSWAPDSKRIILTTGFPEGPTAVESFPIRILDISTLQIEHVVDFEIPIVKLLWSPVSEQVVVITNQNGNFELFIVTTDGATQRIPTLKRLSLFIAWGQEGDKVYYVAPAENLSGEAAIRSIMVETMIDQHILDIGQVGRWFQIAPDGKLVAYVSADILQPTQIFITNLETDEKFAISHPSFSSIMPVWSPDSTMIAFLTEKSQTNQGYSLNVYSLLTGEVKRIVEGCVDDMMPMWRP